MKGTAGVKLVNKYVQSFLESSSDETLATKWAEHSSELGNLVSKIESMAVSKSNNVKNGVTPKRPKTSYLIFCEDERARVTTENASLSAKEVIIKLGARWRELESQDPARYKIYLDKAKLDKARYESEKKEYKAKVDEAEDIAGIKVEEKEANDVQPVVKKAVKKERRVKKEAAVVPDVEVVEAPATCVVEQPPVATLADEIDDVTTVISSNAVKMAKTKKSNRALLYEKYVGENLERVRAENPSFTKIEIKKRLMDDFKASNP